MEDISEGESARFELWEEENRIPFQRAVITGGSGEEELAWGLLSE